MPIDADGPAGVEVVLRGGGTVHVEPVAREDEPRLRRFLGDLSSQARAFRFFSAATDLDEAAQAAASVDGTDSYGVVASSGSEIIAHATFVRTSADRAEIAFAVADRYQGTGISTTLLAHLAEAARERNIDTFTAVVLPANHQMIEVFRESGLPTAVRTEPGELHVEMASSLDAEAQRRFAQRDKIAGAAGVSHVLEPRSVAVVGASARQGSIGGTILRNLLAMGYSGRLTAIHPREQTLHGVPVAPSLRALDAAPELVVVVVPAAAVLEVARDAAAAGASALVVISSGFREAGPEGEARERELVAVCRESGMRLVGPNVLGVINTDPQIALDASFAPRLPAVGNVALLSQSGALGIAAIDTARASGIGLSSFVSVGNKADLSSNDFLQFWEDDDRTDVVMLYLESFGNPRKFARITRRVGRRKPIVIVKAGRSAAGARAAQSHTGALLAGSDATVDALCDQAGLIRVETLSELFDVATLLSRQPPPRGLRVGILTNGGGVGILCADACEAAGLSVVEFSSALRARLTGSAGDGAAVANTVDLLGDGRTEAFGTTAQAIVDSGEVDALIVLAVGTPSADPAAISSAIAALVIDDQCPVTIATVLMPLTGAEPPPSLKVPRFAFPEQAAKAVASAARHGVWRAAPDHEPPEPDPRTTDEGAAIVAAALDAGGGWLSVPDTRRLLALHGVGLIDQRESSDPAAAADAATEVGFPVALKAVAPGLVHKTDAGAVALDLQDASAVVHAAQEMADRLGAAGLRDVTFAIQPMTGTGPELLIGAMHDPSFGPVVVCAAGGTAAEVLRDTATRLAPLSAVDAGAMLRELRTYPLLTGYRGAPACDVQAIERLLVAVAGLADAHPDVAELDLNPVIAGPEGAVVVDARIRVERSPAAPPAPSLSADWP